MTTLTLDVEVTWIYFLVVRLFFSFKHWESVESSVGNRFLNVVRR